MAISIVASTRATGTTIVTVPTGVQNGDLLLLFAGHSGAANVPTLPAGWTQIDASDGVSGPGAITGWRVAASEPANYTVTNNNAGCMIALRGQNATTPINDHSLLRTASGTTINSTAVTTTAANCQIIWYAVTGATITGLPAGYSSDQATGTTSALADIAQPVAGSPGAVTGTQGSSGAQAALVAVAPAASAPVNTVAPAVTGTTTVGQTLSTTNGTWTDNGGSVFTYQWQDSADGSTGWANISSATSSTYVIGSGESSKYIRCVVTDTDSSSQATAANSNVIGPITAAPSLSTVAGKTGTSGTAVMQKAKSGWTYIAGKKNTSGTAVDQKGLGGFTKIKGH